jgi:regulatory factor X
MNVLRSVALSTNSVAASVEPVMQQQFFTLSPMPGQESFSATALEPPPRGGNMSNGMLHTPTTSSMLAALQSDSFPADSFGDFGLPSFMDTAPGAGAPDDAASGLAFPDFGAGATPFDVGGNFGPSDLGMPSGDPAGASPASEHLHG